MALLSIKLNYVSVSEHFFCLVCGFLEKKKLIGPILTCGHVPGIVCSGALMQVFLLPRLGVAS